MRKLGVIAIAGALLLTGCAESGETAPSSAVDEYTQTWSKQYSDTTCDDWNGEMTDHQQFAAAADMLGAAWMKIANSAEMPGDPLIHKFQDAITTACVVPTETITDITYGLWETEPSFHP